MMTFHPLTAEDRAETEHELARAIADRDRLRFRLAALEAEGAPHSYRGTLRYQLHVQERWIAKYEERLNGAVAA